MSQTYLKYQPVIYPDGNVAIHETIVDGDGNVLSVSYEAVKLEALSVGELEDLLRQVYRNMQKTKPITEDELDSMVYKVEMDDNLDIEQDDNVIDLVDYLSR